ncbi:MAG: hypothetical protein ACJ72D_07600 [Marmoricola sp.]
MNEILNAALALLALLVGFFVVVVWTRRDVFSGPAAGVPAPPADVAVRLQR